MSETDQFWLYAKEAILSISYAKTDEESRVCLILRGPGRKRHYERAIVLWAITIAVLSFRQIEETSIVR
jgi:hypothetical protein